MIGWFAAFVSFLLAARSAASALPDSLDARAGGGIRRAENLFHELEETLASGVVPREARWAAVRALDAPWSALAADCLGALRDEGAAVVPTLRRFRELARAHFELWDEARARSAQALAQAAVCAGLVPLFAAALRAFLPEVSRAGLGWWLGAACALGLGLLSGAWVWKMAAEARWGGLRGAERAWMLEAMVFAERLLAGLRLGRSPDRAWQEAVTAVPAELLARWGADPWRSTEVPGEGAARDLRDALLAAGARFKKPVQAALWDGQPCAERIEAVAAGLRAEIRAFQSRELNLLPTRALKPLFLLTAPALLGLLGFALWLSVSAAVDSL